MSRRKKKNRRRFQNKIVANNNRSLIGTTGNIGGDIKENISEYTGDIIHLEITPIIVPTMIDVSCPFLLMPHGIEFRIQHVPKPMEKQENGPSFKAFHVAADHSGCGWWRLHEIEDQINYKTKGSVINSSFRLPREYFLAVEFDAIRLQRQLGPQLVAYWKEIHHMFKEMSTKTRMIYEIDDVVCGTNIPGFNESKADFEDEEVQTSLHHILDFVDEFFVVSGKMREVYKDFHGGVDISVIPNFASRGWFDGYYDLERRMRVYDKNKKRPRILISGGATHVNPNDRLLYSDSDYTKVLDAIISARNDFKFVIMGVQPNQFRSFIENGEMEFCPWTGLPDYPRKLNELDIQCSIAPLFDNIFNRSKSSIKWQEACYEGFGFAGQDMEPYVDARNKFDVGAELIDILKKITKDEQSYQEEIEYNRSQAEKYWLDDKIEDIMTLYKTPYGDPARAEIEWFKKLNESQFSGKKYC